MKEFMAKIRSNRGKRTTPQTQTKQTKDSTTNEKFQIVAEAILSLEDDIATLMKKVEEKE